MGTEHLAYLSVKEAATLLRTTPKAIYAMFARGSLPGARKVGRRLLVNHGELIRWLEESCEASPEGVRR